jgi:hypothetical protein
MSVSRIISGGQTGADRAALNWAIKHGIPHCGWCPKDRLAEDGEIPPWYHLEETPSGESLQPDSCNVRDSDGAVIFTIRSEMVNGCEHAADLAQQHGKPWLHLSEEAEGPDAATRLKRFIEANNIQALHVTGSCASKEPLVPDFVAEVLSTALLDQRAGS